MDDGIVFIPRALWISMAREQLARRKEVFGDKANVCDGCCEILMCSGPISFQLCEALGVLIADGLVSGPKKIPYGRLRRRYLPASEEYLHSRGLRVENGRLVLDKTETNTQKEVNKK